VEEKGIHRNIKVIFILAIEAFLGGMQISVAAHLGAAETVSIDVHCGVVCKEGHGGQMGGWCCGWRWKKKEQLSGHRLEFIAEVRRAVGKSCAHPNMVKGQRQRASSALSLVEHILGLVTFIS
jgi:hypothetical protein